MVRCIQRVQVLVLDAEEWGEGKGEVAVHVYGRLTDKANGVYELFQQAADPGTNNTFNKHHVNFKLERIEIVATGEMRT